MKKPDGKLCAGRLVVVEGEKVESLSVDAYRVVERAQLAAVKEGNAVCGVVRGYTIDTQLCDDVGRKGEKPRIGLCPADGIGIRCRDGDEGLATAGVAGSIGGSDRNGYGRAVVGRSDGSRRKGSGRRTAVVAEGGRVVSISRGEGVTLTGQYEQGECATADDRADGVNDGDSGGATGSESGVVGSREGDGITAPIGTTEGAAVKGKAGRSAVVGRCVVDISNGEAGAAGSVKVEGGGPAAGHRRDVIDGDAEGATGSIAGSVGSNKGIGGRTNREETAGRQTCRLDEGSAGQVIAEGGRCIAEGAAAAGRLRTDGHGRRTGDGRGLTVSGRTEECRHREAAGLSSRQNKAGIKGAAVSGQPVEGESHGSVEDVDGQGCTVEGEGGA